MSPVEMIWSNRRSFNRTIVELKRVRHVPHLRQNPAFNRTIVELKHSRIHLLILAYSTFNRTIVELKLVQPLVS